MQFRPKAVAPADGETDESRVSMLLEVDAGTRRRDRLRFASAGTRHDEASSAIPMLGTSRPHWGLYYRTGFAAQFTDAAGH